MKTMTQHVVASASVKLLLTIPEAAQAMGVSEVYMWRMISGRRKLIPSVKVGRARRIKTSDLEAYVESLSDNADDVA